MKKFVSVQEVEGEGLIGLKGQRVVLLADAGYVKTDEEPLRQTYFLDRDTNTLRRPQQLKISGAIYVVLSPGDTILDGDFLISPSLANGHILNIEPVPKISIGYQVPESFFYAHIRPIENTEKERCHEN